MTGIQIILNLKPILKLTSNRFIYKNTKIIILS